MSNTHINVDKIYTLKILYSLTILGGTDVAVKIRLQRFGTKKRPFYRVVAVDSRQKRDGGVIEYIGKYQPIVSGQQFEIDEEKVLKWLGVGAQPTDTMLDLLKKNGIWKKHTASN